jgi:hypothetical protein
MRKLIAGMTTAAAVVSGVVSAHAQAPFADVPRDHWAYDAVNTLAQRGLIIGYPDGTFGGKRAMTRYEFAVVIARMIPQLEQTIQEKVDAAVSGVKPDGTPVVPPTGNWVSQSDFDTLKKLVDSFAPELQMLQVDVAGLKRDLNDLRGRVGVLETKMDRVQINGEANVMARMSATKKNDLSPVDIDGRRLNGTSKFLEASQVAYDVDLGIKVKANDKVTANALISVGNYLGGYASTSSMYNPYGSATTGSSNAEITPWKAYISAPISVGPLGLINIEAGKTGVQFTPYTLKLVDYDSYTNITKTDNGEVIFNGLKGSFRVGGVGITAFGGTNGNALFQNGARQSGIPLVMTAGSYEQNDIFGGLLQNSIAYNLYSGLPLVVAPITQSAGLRATLGVPFGGTLGLNYVSAGINGAFASNTAGVDPIGTSSHGQVYGADLALKLFKGIGVTAEYSNSNLTTGTSQKAFSNDNSAFTDKNLHDAYDVRANFGIKSIALSAGYRQVDPFFGAPGAWGSLGSWKNPTNIKGFVGTVGVPITSGISLAGSYEDYKSVINGQPGPNTLDKDSGTKIQHWTAGLKFNLSSANGVDLGVEQVNLNPNDGLDNKARQTFYNIGFGTKVSDNASFKLLYQIIDYKDRDADLLYNGNDAKGSLAMGQFQVKF